MRKRNLRAEDVETSAVMRRFALLRHKAWFWCNTTESLGVARIAVSEHFPLAAGLKPSFNVHMSVI